MISNMIDTVMPTMVAVDKPELFDLSLLFSLELCC